MLETSDGFLIEGEEDFQVFATNTAANDFTLVIKTKGSIEDEETVQVLTHHAVQEQSIKNILETIKFVLINRYRVTVIKSVLN